MAAIPNDHIKRQGQLHQDALPLSYPRTWSAGRDLNPRLPILLLPLLMPSGRSDLQLVRIQLEIEHRILSWDARLPFRHIPPRATLIRIVGAPLRHIGTLWGGEASSKAQT